jgi:hypothetical protein
VGMIQGGDSESWHVNVLILALKNKGGSPFELPPIVIPIPKGNYLATSIFTLCPFIVLFFIALIIGST